MEVEHLFCRRLQQPTSTEGHSIMHTHACEHRTVREDGRIICAKMVVGDNQVSARLCRGCPARACNCQHLRFSLQQLSFSPIIVRWGNGHTEIWDDQPPAVAFLHSACALKTIHISSLQDCIRCRFREPVLPEEQSGQHEAFATAQRNFTHLVEARAHREPLP